MLVLDAFCGEGGAAAGIKQTWPNADILGIDANPAVEARYPFAFRLDDAVSFIAAYGHLFDFIWASPPCHAYSWATGVWGHENYVDYLIPTRNALRATQRPYIIENVLEAPLYRSALLCGTMFDLRVFRHRQFEANFPVEQPIHPSHNGKRLGKGVNDYKTVVGHHAGIRYWSRAIGIDWMSKEGIVEAVPPAYSAYLSQFIPGVVGEDSSTSSIHRLDSGRQL